MMNHIGTTCLIICIVIPLVLIGCGDEAGDRAEPSQNDSKPLNIVLVTLDTLRADYVGCYGSTEVETPNLDRIASEGAVFLDTSAVAPLTLPSHASLFTGNYPFHHGVRDNLGFRLPEEERTLAEILSEAGWNTAGFISAYVLDDSFGTAQGFSHYSVDLDFEKGEIISGSTVQRDGREMLDDLYAWLDDNHEAPFFVWAHFFDPHMPYEPPEPFASKYPMNPYAGEVAYTDALVGELMDKLDALGHASDTVVAIVGDHGESLGDHGEKYHGLFIYDTTIRVPFIMKGPRITPARIEDPVRMIDIMPTLLDLVGIQGDFKPEDKLLKGQSLTPLLFGEKKSLDLLGYSESHYPSLHYGWSNLISLRAGSYKYIQAPKPELYDLATDPDEKKNLIDEQPEIASKMLKNLEELGRLAGKSKMSRVEAGSDTAEALRALGYTGTVAPGGDETSMPDPKDKVHLLNRLEQGERLIASGQPLRAVPIIEEVIREAPRMLDAHISLGIAQITASNHDVAAGIFERVLEMDPKNFIALMNLAICKKQLGRTNDAQRIYEKAMDLEPSNQGPADALVDLHLSAGKVKKAIKACRRFIEANPENVSMRLTLASCSFHLGNTRDAMQAVEDGLKVDDRGKGLNLMKAKILEEWQRFDEAEQAYKTELTHHEKNADALEGLGRLLEQQKKWEELVAVYPKALKAHPDNFACHLRLARAYLELGISSDESIAAAARAVELDTSSQEAWNMLNTLQERKGARRK